MKYTDEEIVAATELRPALWVLQNEIKNERGIPIEFEKRRFLYAIYNDLSPLQVWLKPPQIGATVGQTIKSFYVAKKLNRQIIYTLPTQSDVQAMVGGSINRIIAQNPVLMDWVRDHDTVEQKTVGDSMIFYRGTFTAKQAMMIPSGLNIHDEVDASDPDVINQYETRLQAQEDGGWRWYFSHPSVSGVGVDIYWQQSDKKEWFITCPNCHHEQFLEWPANIDAEREEFVCSRCRGILGTEDRIYGEWRATAEGPFSGYHVSQLMLYNKTAKDILAVRRDPMKDEQYFWNYVLGLPYVASENRLQPSVVLKNVVDEVNSQESRVIIGVDTGLPIHFVCLNKEGIFYYDTCENYSKLEELLKRWPKSVLVSDQGGDLIGIRELQAKYPGRVFLVYYRKDRKNPRVIDWGSDKNWGKVDVDRNVMIQLMVEQFRDVGRIRLNGKTEEWEEFASHFGNIYRELRIVKEAKGKDDPTLYGTELIWKRNGPDHFVHATLYGLVGLDKYAETMAKIVGQDDMAGIPTGRIFKDDPQAHVEAIRQEAQIVGGFSAEDFSGPGVDF